MFSVYPVEIIARKINFTHFFLIYYGGYHKCDGLLFISLGDTFEAWQNFIDYIPLVRNHENAALVDLLITRFDYPNRSWSDFRTGPA